MRIVCLDGYTLNPGDLGWERFRALGELTVYDRTPRELTTKHAAGAEAVLTNKTVLDRGAIESLPRLRYVGVLATGYNVVDLAAAREREIVVTNVPAYGTPSVAQTVFAHILNLTQNVAGHASSVREGAWSRSADFCYWVTPLVELDGLTLGIVGLGRIGRAVAKIARAFGMRVLAYDLTPPSGPLEDVEMTDLERVFRESDVVTLHCPLTRETEKLVNAERLGVMKRTAFLVNASRGGVVDERALADALNAGRIAGAGLDVLSTEPPDRSNPLLEAKNCFITPHVAWATRAARQRLINIAADNLEAFLAGTPQNVVTE